MELAGGVGCGWGQVGSPAAGGSVVEGEVGVEEAGVEGLGGGHCRAGRAVHLCERLQGFEPVRRVVVLKTVQTVSCRGRDTCDDGRVHPAGCAVPAQAVRDARWPCWPADVINTVGG